VGLERGLGGLEDGEGGGVGLDGVFISKKGGYGRYEHMEPPRRSSLQVAAGLARQGKTGL